MRAFFALLACLVAAVPVAMAQDMDEPPQETGNSGGTPTEQETVEQTPGIVYGLFVLGAVLGFAALLALVMRRQTRAKERLEDQRRRRVS